jgi:hypothetical protein
VIEEQSPRRLVFGGSPNIPPVAAVYDRRNYGCAAPCFVGTRVPIQNHIDHLEDGLLAAKFLL